MEFVEQVKSSADIVKTIGEYVRLRKAGAGPRYTGLCPFHSEKTPSFSVHGGHQFYKCFGCGAGGDVFKFLMDIEGLGFYEALKLLAERNGIPMPKRTGIADADSRLRAAIAEMHELAAGLYQDNLRSPGGIAAREYLVGRGVAKEHWSEFGLGLADASGQQLIRRLEQRGFPAEFLEQSGLVRKRPEGGFYDYFRGRLIFPIHGESGQVIAFAGRSLRPGDEPKYLNSPETKLYHKSSVLYNLHRARNAIRSQDRSILVEGYMDVIGVWSAGVHEVVASCGTALRPEQVRALRRHSERIFVNFDPDNAGGSATERSLEMLLEEQMRVRVIELDGGLDPDEYVRQFGADGYRAKLDAASGYFHWLGDRARRKFDMHSIEGRLEGWKFLLPAIQSIPDRLERMAVANDAAGYLGVDRSFVLDQFRKFGGGSREPRQAPSSQAVPSVERLLLNSLVTSAEARAEAIPRLRDSGLSGQFVTRGIFDALFAICAPDKDFRFADLEARLGDADRALLAALCLADEENGAETAYQQAMQCLHDLGTQESETQRSALESQIKEVERAGDLPRALRLHEELQRLPVRRQVRRWGKA